MRFQEYNFGQMRVPKPVLEYVKSEAEFFLGYGKPSCPQHVLVSGNKNVSNKEIVREEKEIATNCVLYAYGESKRN
ncbi:hypothetical protein ANN_07029 [Periplaneta americana]|uniref:Per a allergen n=1 Tax=Periplaneta americana TaxID=6978 RepID=A0ABQ8TF46_PERAM|nr:hypothetical protein ANN_07029 [Periplaneta americana]